MIVLVDTGVLIALIDPDTREHRWAQDSAKRLPPRNKMIPVLMPDDEQTPGGRLAESRVTYRVRRKSAKGA